MIETPEIENISIESCLLVDATSSNDEFYQAGVFDVPVGQKYLYVKTARPVWNNIPALEAQLLEWAKTVSEVEPIIRTTVNNNVVYSRVIFPLENDPELHMKAKLASWGEL